MTMIKTHQLFAFQYQFREGLILINYDPEINPWRQSYLPILADAINVIV